MRVASFGRLAASACRCVNGLWARPAAANSSRFAEFDSERPRGEVTGSVPQPGNRVESRALPRLGDGVSGGGRGMGSYQPGNGDVTGALPPSAPPPPPPPRFTWEGGTPITVAPGETLETIARRYDVPVAALMEANNITRPGGVHPGQHLVIPRRRGPATALAAPPTRVASSAAAMPSPAPVGPPRNALAAGASVHVVAPGETLHSIARHYGKPVLVLAKANNIAPDTHGEGRRAHHHTGRSIDRRRGSGCTRSACAAE